ncbi:MAG: hypothetical protein OHK0012_19190 [Synechococcales cyanobacterium]
MLSPSAEKALSMFLILIVGVLFRSKFEDARARAGLRTLILSVALPASIFTSILGIKSDFDFVTPPLFAAAINLFFLGSIWVLVRFWFVDSTVQQKRSLMMIFPSLAPGLTAFPFIEDFLGTNGLAWAAMSDVGNKIFVLFGLYGLAVFWGQRASQGLINADQFSIQDRIKSLLVALLSEPINISILLGFVLMTFGISLETLPQFIGDALSRIGGLTTGLILLFVGLSFRFNFDELIEVMSVLFVRTGLGFLLSALILHLLPIDFENPLLYVVMPQCGCSLWPFLHMVKVDDQVRENLKKYGKEADTKEGVVFNTDYAMSLLTMSFPFSIGIVLFIFADPEPFQSSLDLVFVGMVFLMLHFLFKQAAKGHEIKKKHRVSPRHPSAPLPATSPTFQNLSVNELSRRKFAETRPRRL